MSGRDYDLLDSSKVYSLFGNTPVTSASSQDEEILPGPQEAVLTHRIRKNTDAYDSRNDKEDVWTSRVVGAYPALKESFENTSDSAETEDVTTPLDFAKVAEGRRLVIAIDYGTTFTGVAIALVPVDEETAKLDDITILREWHKMSNSDKVPSVFSYTKPTHGEEQWGNDLSADAVTMVHTKLELDAQQSRLDELDMILHHLDGMRDLRFDHVEKSNGNPEFTANKPEIVVLDYMKKIFARVMHALATIPDELRSSLLVDVVITHPVVWSYKAKNATYRAVTLAGFNKQTFPGLREVMMLSEAEAAAVYTARYLKEVSPEKLELREGDTFVLCDAGGGTVDVVTFRVDEVDKIVKLTQIGVPHSGKCGSVNIDGTFKRWLRDYIIGPDDYQMLEPNTRKRIKPYSTTGQKMREIMSQFINHKCNFRGDEPDDDDDSNFKIELPKEFEDLYIEGFVKECQLTINNDLMAWFFGESIDQIVELVKQQAQFVEEQAKGSRRVKAVLMIGGFGESYYLQSTIREALGEREIAVHRPETSWTAVVRGAALYGIEQERLENYAKAIGCPCYCAIVKSIEEPRGVSKDQNQDKFTGKFMARNRLTWILNRGDLAISRSAASSSPLPECKETMLAFNFREHEDRDFKISIYKYLEKDDALPNRVREDDPELECVASIPITFPESKLEEFDLYPGVDGREPYYQAVVSLFLTWKNDSIKATVKWGEKIIYGGE